MDCTIRIIAGPDAGQTHVCAVETVIGRSQRCAVRLSSSSVSYEHALITRAGDDYFVENLSANGTFVNNERITGRTRLRLRDQIRLGPDDVLRVESLPAAARAGSSRKWMVGALVAMLVILVAVLIIDPLAETPENDWNKAYTSLQEFVNLEVTEKRLPADAAGLLREAWRLRAAGDRPGARAQWLRLHVVLNDSEARTGYQGLSRQHPGALGKLLRPQDAKGEPSDQEKGAALLQFVVAMQRSR